MSQPATTTSTTTQPTASASQPAPQTAPAQQESPQEVLAKLEAVYLEDLKSYSDCKEKLTAVQDKLLKSSQAFSSAKEQLLLGALQNLQQKVKASEDAAASAVPADTKSSRPDNVAQ